MFYPFAFSPVCTDQLQLYEGELAAFAERGVTLYGVSCDSSWSQRAFKEKLSVTSEQLSDFEPKGAACAAFGVLHEGGFPQRALVMIGPDGVVGFSYQADSPGDLPGVGLLLEGVAASPSPALSGGADAAASRGARRRCARRLRPSAKLREFGKEKQKRTADRRAEQEGSEYEQ